MTLHLSNIQLDKYNTNSGRIKSSDSAYLKMGLCSMAFRLCFFLFNLMFFIGGCFVIGMGAHIAVKFKKYFGDFTNCDGTTTPSTRQVNANVESCKAYPEIEAIPYVIIVVGVFVSIIPFIGCCAAWSESKRMMGCFACLLSMIFLVEVAGFILLFVYKDAVLEAIREPIENMGAIPTVIEKEFDCGQGEENLEECIQKLEKYIGDHITTFALIGIGIFVIQLISIIGACFLQFEMGQKNYYHKYVHVPMTNLPTL